MPRFCKWKANTKLHGYSAAVIRGPHPSKFVSFSNSGPLQNSSFFIISSFMQDPDDDAYDTTYNAEALAAIGVNTIFACTIETAQMASKLERWKDNGIYIFLDLTTYSGQTVSWALDFLESNPTYNSTIIGWITIEDESDGKYNLSDACSPLAVLANATTARQTDPTRPLSCTYTGAMVRSEPMEWYHPEEVLNQNNTTGTYQGDMDAYSEAPNICLFDKYPMTGELYAPVDPEYATDSEGNPAYYGGMWVAGRTIDGIRANIWRVNEECPIIAALEDANPWEEDAARHTGPTPSQLKQMVQMCIVHGARGILWFGHTWGNDGNGSPASFNSLTSADQYQIADKMAALTEIHAWIQDLAPVLNSPTLGTIYYGGDNYQLEGKELLPSGYSVVSSTGVPISSMVRIYNGTTYWFTMSDGSEGLTSSGITSGTFTATSAINKLITVRDESRTIQANSSGTWSDGFDPYELHLYTWS
jgi:hypothetical protein